VHTLARSAPVRLRIPAIGVDGRLQRLGRSADGNTVALPAPDRAGWYSQSSTPGQAGPTVVVGYIAGPHGAGVFAHLARLRPHSRVSLTRADGRTVVFEVDTIAHYPANHLPVQKVYGNTADSVLRIVTCGGKLHRNDAAGNVVVYAHELRVLPRPQAR